MKRIISILCLCTIISASLRADNVDIKYIKNPLYLSMINRMLNIRPSEGLLTGPLIRATFNYTHPDGKKAYFTIYKDVSTGKFYGMGDYASADGPTKIVQVFNINPKKPFIFLKNTTKKVPGYDEKAKEMIAKINLREKPVKIDYLETDYQTGIMTSSGKMEFIKIKAPLIIAELNYINPKSKLERIITIIKDLTNEEFYFNSHREGVSGMQLKDSLLKKIEPLKFVAEDQNNEGVYAKEIIDKINKYEKKLKAKRVGRKKAQELYDIEVIKKE